jgi:hypothetical protein
MAFKGASVYNSADRTTINATTAQALTFNSELFDTDAFHDTGSGTSKLTIPSGVTLVQLLGSINLDLVTNSDVITAEIRKNGNPLSPVVANRNTIVGATPSVNVISPVLQVVAGDYFELFLTVSSDTSITIRQRSWFSIMEVPSTFGTFSGAVVKKSVDQTAANYTTATAIAFDAEEYDTDGYHDNASNNTRLTVPSGVSYVRLHAIVSVTGLSAGEFAFLEIYKGGLAMTPQVTAIYMTGSSLTAPSVMIFTPVLAVSAGNYFEVRLQVATDTSITITALETFFSIEKVG